MKLVWMESAIAMLNLVAVLRYGLLFGSENVLLIKLMKLPRTSKIKYGTSVRIKKGNLFFNLFFLASLHYEDNKTYFSGKRYDADTIWCSFLHLCRFASPFSKHEQPAVDILISLCITAGNGPLLFNVFKGLHCMMLKYLFIKFIYLFQSRHMMLASINLGIQQLLQSQKNAKIYCFRVFRNGITATIMAQGWISFHFCDAECVYTQWNGMYWIID